MLLTTCFRHIYFIGTWKIPYILYTIKSSVISLVVFDYNRYMYTMQNISCIKCEHFHLKNKINTQTSRYILIAMNKLITILKRQTNTNGQRGVTSIIGR